MQLVLEIEGAGPASPLPGDGAGLIAFMSFAVMRGFGATHPLIALADRLHDVQKLHLGPLTTFYEARPEDREDEEKLAMAWQDPKPLGAALSGLAGALESDPQCAALARRGGADEVATQARALIPAVEAAAAAGQRVRLVYEL